MKASSRHWPNPAPLRRRQAVELAQNSQLLLMSLFHRPPAGSACATDDAPVPGTSPSLPSSSATSSSRCRFAPPKTAREAGIPHKTEQDTRYCKKVWDQWREHRMKTTGVNIAPLHHLSLAELAHWLTNFILEVRKKSGEVYPPNSLYHICCGLMRHVRWSRKPQVDFLKDPEFSDFRASLDAEMKRIQGDGVGSKKKQAEIHCGKRVYCVMLLHRLYWTP